MRLQRPHANYDPLTRRDLDKRQISSYNPHMRRKSGHLLPIELGILEAAIRLRMEGVAQFYGFLVAKEIKEQREARLLTAHGTLYKALDRLQRLGMLESEWEDPIVAAQANRPRRRLYWVTAAGEAALVPAAETAPRPVAQPRRGLAPS